MNRPLSVIIITYNAATQLEPCLQSVAFADEIIVVDSGSTDSTATLVNHHSAKFLHQDWLGYGPQKQFSVEQAQHDWVLCVDADERISQRLKHSIIETLQAPQYNAYEMPRCNRFMGRWLRFGEGYPDYNLRLFHRAHAHWTQDIVHEHVVLKSSNEQKNKAVGRLAGDLQHESQETLEQYLAKQNRYTSLQAEAMLQRKTKVGLARIVLSPLTRFIKFYFLRQGFRDGLPGLTHILIGCYNSFLKYVKLIELRKNQQEQRR
ncbi:Lipopolysaccharide core biosynthesis glycosyltransferase, group 2 family protein [hydrothermal vent metagenome]|uniref:Lipopolysaccharide core biosynthesis glycosyltransferase, group 2 family protein n=1 Tax=hydrothermal vent metagenome TaxID=652676 RepID=A0A3B1A4L2_9ZZZZ